MDRIDEATFLNKIAGPNKRPPSPCKPWEAQEAEIIKNAAYFTVVLLLGCAKYYREEHPTLAEAQASRAQLPSDPYGRKYAIYAVSAQGRSVFVKEEKE